MCLAAVAVHGALASPPIVVLGQLESGPVAGRRGQAGWPSGTGGLPGCGIPQLLVQVREGATGGWLMRAVAEGMPSGQASLGPLISNTANEFPQIEPRILERFPPAL
jgi:hypothetical protein